MIANMILPSEKEEYRSDPESYYYLYGEEGMPWFNSENKGETPQIDVFQDTLISQSQMDTSILNDQ